MNRRQISWSRVALSGPALAAGLVVAVPLVTAAGPLTEAASPTTTAVTATTAPANERAVTISARAARASAIYAVGEEIAFDVRLADPPPGRLSLEYTARAGGVTEIAAGKLGGNGGRVSVKLDGPGTVLLEVRARSGDGMVAAKALAGAAVEPGSIAPSAPEPADFQRFWDAKLAELATVPMAAIVEPVEPPAGLGTGGVRYEKVTLAGFRGSQVYGQLARPRAQGKYPAVLVLQWAGVYPLRREFVTGWANDGWLALNVIAHDVPFDLPDAEFERLSDTTLKEYIYQGMEDRERSYFLRMYLNCHRAAEYLTTREDWDGRVLVVTGTSQGGQQAVVTAALHPRVTAVLANVPAGCDTTGHLAGRATGFPYWYGRAQGRAADREKILGTSPYFDLVHFARRVRVPTLVGLGLIDTTCPPSGVLAMTNVLGGPKEVIVAPEAGHQGPHKQFEARSKEWLAALKKGKAPPLGRP